jgi:glutamate synthase (NADPH/NADH) small chain
MPEVCGRICPQDRLCEGACVIEQSEHGAVTIGASKSTSPKPPGAKAGSRRSRRARSAPRAVGIIGAGPAGLAAAEHLRRRGYQVTCLRSPRPHRRPAVYGIPELQAREGVVQRRAQRLIDGGVTFELNCNVGETISFADLCAKHDAC